MVEDQFRARARKMVKKFAKLLSIGASPLATVPASEWQINNVSSNYVNRARERPYLIKCPHVCKRFYCKLVHLSYAYSSLYRSRARGIDQSALLGYD